MDESVDDIFCIGVGGDVDLDVFFADCLVVINFAVVGEAPDDVDDDFWGVAGVDVPGDGRFDAGVVEEFWG